MKNALFFIIQRNTEGIAQAMKLEGDTEKLDLILENINQLKLGATPSFNIVEP